MHKSVQVHTHNIMEDNWCDYEPHVLAIQIVFVRLENKIDIFPDIL